MERGKDICNQLKAVRQRIAEENDIPLAEHKCTHQGPCRGTCPQCDSEVLYLERELGRRRTLGRAVAVAGVALGIAIGSPAAAQTPVSNTPVTDTVVEEEVEEDFILGTIAESDPEFPGGIESLYKYLAENIHYPAEAKEKGIEGKVYVTFAVEKDGSITDIKVLRDIGGDCGEEAVRVVKTMPRWTPGTQRGKKVRVQFYLPVNFKLPEEK